MATARINKLDTHFYLLVFHSLPIFYLSGQKVGS
ncbi:hypothetical protein PSECIP111951_04175 [Pseudoalteromonas holothuriae]|uniref:Uncharacterized protein n=1 Tax=Pseudoalteromonas holothuriae TaxID=2963714 RepID=A0ABN8US11_9GAMM|nr:hypothetical protein PSECIP111951_04175 [Pseudoalteromonas sp. CIP111951]